MILTLLVSLYILSFSAPAAEIAAPGKPSAGATETGGRGELKARLDLVCKDLALAVCAQNAEPVHDGTGSTQEARVETQATIESARDYYHGTLIRTQMYGIAMNQLLRSGDHRLVTLTGVKCDPAQIPCQGEMRKKLHEIFEAGFVRGLGFGEVETVSYGCDSGCKYSQAQADAYMDLLRARKLDRLFDVHDGNVGAFFRSQNFKFRKRTRETLWPFVKEEMKAQLAKMGLSQAHLHAIGLKIDRTELSFNCTGEGHDPNSFAWSSIDPRRITICEGLMRGNTSDFAMVSDLAHELAHQFDPCFIHFGDEGFKYSKIENPESLDDYLAQNPFGAGLKCLRAAGIGHTGGFSDRGAAAALNLDSPAVDQKTPFCRGDRLQEGFADAMGARVLAGFADGDKKYAIAPFPEERVRAGLINASVHIVQPSAMCSDPSRLENQSSDDDYPTKVQRVNQLLMGNKSLRGLAGCSGSSSTSQCL